MCFRTSEWILLDPCTCAGIIVQRNRTILVLTCLTVRAVHLELVRDMSADSLIQALKRFFARRGIPRVIYSDNFRTFRRVAKDIQIAFRDSSQRKVYEHLASRRIIWKFITERAPWAGGAWERLVRSVKTALKKTLHRSLLNADEMMTMLCEVESQINARPLTFVGEDPRDQEPLTPFHFLHGRPPEVNTTVERDNLPTPAFATELTKRWQYYRVVLSQLWKRWKKEYIIKLSARNAWTRESQSPSVGDIVLVAESGVPRIRWRLGRVIEIFPSRDGLVRTVRVRTANGDFNRPVQRLDLLESATEQ
ncbi:hypothetical protein M514_13649 [Trichuris suis]|uniref:Integrase catalytic domain-containing protein n=1 Tax=Trichuris suis TaxID=68888 RepID=A0A085MX53_9BILA|nr:hypothetical protein M514_13649 [Trichuris suis]